MGKESENRKDYGFWKRQHLYIQNWPWLAAAKALSEETMPEERAEVIAWLNKVKFPTKLFGGVDERTVWRRISELDALYAKLLAAERLRSCFGVKGKRSICRRGGCRSPAWLPLKKGKLSRSD